MDSFEGLGLSDGLVEILSAEGFEVPTALQRTAIPVIRRGHPFVAACGPGAGVQLAWAAPMLDRLQDDPEGRVLVLAEGNDSSERSARSLARLAAATPVTVAALGGGWAAPFEASILVGTPRRAFEAVQASRLSLDGVTAVVLEGTGAVDAPEADSLVELIPGAQRLVFALPWTPETEEFVTRHVRKAMRYPADAPDGAAPRGSVRYRIAPEPRSDALVALVAGALERGVTRILVHARSDDHAADLGDLLALHGHAPGAPDDPEARVWLAVPGGPRPETWAGVLAVSVDVPVDPQSLIEQHAEPSDSAVLLSSRELPHLRDTAARAGFGLEPLPARPAAPHHFTAVAERLAETRTSGGLAGWLAVAERLAEDHDPLEVAAAALSLAFDAGPPSGAAPSDSRGPVDAPAPRGAVDPFVRVFLSVGSRDGVRPGDLLGAITGESGVDGGQVGKIEIKDTFSLVEVPGAQADRVIRSLNGTTVKGRSVRADYDRQSARRTRTR